MRMPQFLRQAKEFGEARNTIGRFDYLPQKRT
jgi:hypothetical protein